MPKDSDPLPHLPPLPKTVQELLVGRQDSTSGSDIDISLASRARGKDDMLSVSTGFVFDWKREAWPTEQWSGYGGIRRMWREDLEHGRGECVLEEVAMWKGIWEDERDTNRFDLS